MSVTPDLAGALVNCPNCNQEITMPNPEGSQSTEEVNNRNRTSRSSVTHEEPVGTVDGRQKRESIVGMLCRFGVGLVQESKRIAYVVVLRVNLQKLKSVDMKNAYLNLGKKAYQLGVPDGEITTQFQEVEKVKREIESKKTSHALPPNSGAALRVSCFFIRMSNVLGFKILDQKLNHRLVEFGKLFVERCEAAELHDEIEACKILNIKIRKAEDCFKSASSNEDLSTQTPFNGLSMSLFYSLFGLVVLLISIVIIKYTVLAETPQKIVAAYLNCAHWEDRLALVVPASGVRDSMAAYYVGSQGKNYSPIEPKIRPSEIVVKTVPCTEYTKAFSAEVKRIDKSYLVVKVGGNYKIDWRGSGGINDTKLSVYKATYPEKDITFRLIAKLSDYYNYDFSDARSTHFSIELNEYYAPSADAVFGYVEKDAPQVGDLLSLLSDGNQHKITLKLKYPRKGRNSQVTGISKIVALNWFDPIEIGGSENAIRKPQPRYVDSNIADLYDAKSKISSSVRDKLALDALKKISFESVIQTVSGSIPIRSKWSPERGKHYDEKELQEAGDFEDSYVISASFSSPSDMVFKITKIRKHSSGLKAGYYIDGVSPPVELVKCTTTSQALEQDFADIKEKFHRWVKISRSNALDGDSKLMLEIGGPSALNSILISFIAPNHIRVLGHSCDLVLKNQSDIDLLFSFLQNVSDKRVRVQLLRKNFSDLCDLEISTARKSQERKDTEKAAEEAKKRNSDLLR